MLTSSTVPETDYPEYVAGTTYAAGDKVIETASGVHKIYESLVGGNVGNYPPTDVLAAVPKWLEIGATNRWAVFDSKVGSQTSKAPSMSYTLAPGMFDSIALLNMDATGVSIVMTDPVDGEVYNEAIDLLSTASVIDGYTYCFEPILRKTDLVLLDLPPYSTATVVITVTNTGGTAKCGAIILGMKATIGTTLRSGSVGITDYSVKTVDAFGNYTIVKRANAKRGSYDVQILNTLVDEVFRMLTEQCSIAVVWIGIDGYTSTYSYGFYKDFSIVIAGVLRSDCSIEIEGLT